MFWSGWRRPTPRVAAHERIYAIGDVHGRADLLDAMLDLVAADAAGRTDGRRTRLVLLGDYVDRGPDSRAVLDRAIALAADGAICLRGNHEAALLDFLADPVAGIRWLEVGGVAALASYGVPRPDRDDPAALRAAADALASAMGPHLRFVSDLPMMHVSGDVVFVHAALAPGVRLEAQSAAAMLWGDARFLARGYDRRRLVVHGHTAGNEPVVAAGRICVDTRAHKTGRLTAVRLDEGVAFLST